MGPLESAFENRSSDKIPQDCFSLGFTERNHGYGVLYLESK